ncbi:YopX protein [Algoriella xinjiangensis]|uniref:YopX family protein n=1 Tax=Algoriella xinjiangensis TaxID=684065 RepID=UPI000F62F01B|nr:YopX family protein [Algoriella xinjiangensis]VDH16726.1 YopX protein [Algoriella xinjiangensis]
MKEILFRGQRVDNGEWVYGSYIENSIDSPCIIDYDANQFEIKKESISQFTGLLDKNGNKIFEGDKVKAFGISYYQVVYNDGAFYLRKENSHLRLSRTIQDLEIIGNIHEEK